MLVQRATGLLLWQTRLPSFMQQGLSIEQGLIENHSSVYYFAPTVCNSPLSFLIVYINTSLWIYVIYPLAW